MEMDRDFTESETGSWNVSKKNGRVVECDGHKVITAANTPWHPTEAWANARLAAASPDMFEALIMAVAYCDAIESGKEPLPLSLWSSCCRLALKNATGVEQ